MAGAVSGVGMVTAIDQAGAVLKGCPSIREGYKEGSFRLKRHTASRGHFWVRQYDRSTVLSPDSAVFRMLPSPSITPGKSPSVHPTLLYTFSGPNGQNRSA